MLTVRPQPGDFFAVPGRRDLLRVARLIAVLPPDTRDALVYLVQSPAGARWALCENPEVDGPRWIGRAVPAETER